MKIVKARRRANILISINIEESDECNANAIDFRLNKQILSVNFGIQNIQATLDIYKKYNLVTKTLHLFSVIHKIDDSREKS
jgi:hypothetical protein